MDLNTAQRLKKIAVGKRSATTGPVGTKAIDPEGITENRCPNAMDSFFSSVLWNFLTVPPIALSIQVYGQALRARFLTFPY